MRTSYAVLWQEVVDTSCSGRLELGRDRLRLEGMRRPGGGPKATELLYEEITCVRIGRTAGERLDGRSSVVVETERGPEACAEAASKPPARKAAAGNGR